MKKKSKGKPRLKADIYGRPPRYPNSKNTKTRIRKKKVKSYVLQKPEYTVKKKHVLILNWYPACPSRINREKINFAWIKHFEYVSKIYFLIYWYIEVAWGQMKLVNWIWISIYSIRDGPDFRFPMPGRIWRKPDIWQTSRPDTVHPAYKDMPLDNYFNIRSKPDIKNAGYSDHS